MPAKQTYTIGQTAVLVGKPTKALPTSTIRGWTTEFAAHLSAGANPGQQRERRYDDRDVAVLRLVHHLRGERMPIADIKERLSETTVAAGETISPSAPVPADTLSAPADQSTALALPAAFDALDQRLRGIEQRVIAAENTKRFTLAVVLAFAAGGLLVGIVALLFVWLR